MAPLTKKQLQDNVAANFRHIRLDFEMTTKQMGEKLGLLQKTYAAIEEGRASEAIHVYRMSEYTGISMTTLFCKRINLNQ